MLPLTLDVASFPVPCSKYPSGSELQIGQEWGLSSVIVVYSGGSVSITDAQEWQLCFVSGNQHLCVCKMYLWLEMLDNLF